MPSHLPTRTKQKRRHPNQNPAIFKCVLCRTFHPLRFCPKFLRMTLRKKEDFIEENRYCVNCLAKSHDLRSCTSMVNCKFCDKFHHTLLHPPQRRRKRSQRNKQKGKPTPTPSPATKPSQSVTSSTTMQPTQQQANIVIIEAIRSLAQVLCTNAGSQNVA